MNFKMILMMALPAITFGENYYRNKDNNDVGNDDKIAKFLGYARKGLEAIIYDKPLPDAPQGL